MSNPRSEATGETRDRGVKYFQPGGPSPIANIVAELDGGPYYLISEASEETGIPVSTLRRWYKLGPDKGGTKAPSKVHHHLGIVIYLYTPEDLVELKARRRPTTIKDRTETP